MANRELVGTAPDCGASARGPSRAAARRPTAIARRDGGVGPAGGVPAPRLARDNPGASAPSTRENRAADRARRRKTRSAEIR